MKELAPEENYDLEELRASLRIIYSEIIQGYTLSRDLGCYIKHFNDEDLARVDQEVNLIRKSAMAQGLPTQRGRIEELVENGSWTLEQESEYEGLTKHKKILQDNMEMAHGTLKEPYLKDIEEADKKLNRINAMRDLSVGLTLEKYTDKRRSDLYVYYSFYSDAKCETLFWEKEEFDELDQDEVNHAVLKYNKLMEQFTHNNIKRIGCQPYFLNKFFITTGDPLVFFGKSAVCLTQYQSELLSQGRMYKNILEHNEKGDSPPEAWYDDPDKLVQWYYGKAQMSSGLPSRETQGTQDKDWTGATTVPGASVKDLIDMNSGDEVVDLNAELSKVIAKKGRADIYDILKIHGEDVSMIERET